MVSIPFTRDEAILLLDTVYFSGEKHFSPHSEAVEDLSKLLNSLPIHPLHHRPENFRNCSGLSGQINGFLRSRKIGVKNPHVGQILFDVAFEYENRHHELHEISEAIKRNIPYYSNFFSGNSIKFPEGVLLGYLHKWIESCNGKRENPSAQCEICGIDLHEIYSSSVIYTERHLLISPVCLNGNSSYSPRDFINVCPNCHASLHQYRPWRTRDNCDKILK